MDSIASDPRFSHIASDPRFRPMPKAKRKVKIDKRFNALFSSKHFKTRTDIDKRGRPVQDISKRNKHVMERFYELSSNESDRSSDEDDVDDNDEEQNGVEDSEEEATVKNFQKTNKSKKKIPKVDMPTEKLVKTPGKKRKLSDIDNETKSKQKKIKKVRLEDDGVGNDLDGKKGSDTDDEDHGPDKDDDVDKGDSDHSDVDGEPDSSGDEDSLPEYTQDFDLEETGLEHKWNELHKDATDVSESTRRLAVCNMDWDFVKAQDLFVLLKSFVPEGGRVKSVTIYPSEFGKERMAEEALLGPKEMRDMTQADESDVDAASHNAEEDVANKKKSKKRKKISPLDQKQLKLQDKGMVKRETEKLREYQLNRLRYYYAVVDCDSALTADRIYSECDGKEYQLSSVRLDLRFIPDDMTFDDEPKDSFSEEHGLIDYAPNRFNSTALSQAKVQVTWDETDFDRLSRHIVGLQQKELESIVEENQYADMIAPPESDSESEADNPDWLKEALADEEEEEEVEGLTEEKKIQLYRKLLIEKQAEEKEAEDGDIDKEIQWTPGLKSSAQEKLKKKKKGKEVSNDVVEGYLEKKKEKRRKKLEKKKKKEMAPAADDGDDGSDEAAFSDDDLPELVDDDLKDLMESEGFAMTKKSKGKKKLLKKQEEEVEDSEAERERAELELLMMGDRETPISQPEKVKEGKMSRKKKKKMEKLAKKKRKEEKQRVALDMDDNRFSALFTSHHFHIDPNAPQFKKTDNMMKLVNEQISHKKKGKMNSQPQVETPVSGGLSDSKLVSKQLVENLKRKMKK